MKRRKYYLFKEKKKKKKGKKENQVFTLQTPPSFTKKISFLKKMSLQNYFHTFFFLDHLDKLLNPDTDQKIIQTMSKF